VPYNEDKTKFNGYTIFIKDDYECIYANGKFKYVHRLIVEEDIRRKLTIDEDVHHEDENKRNNDRTNLKIKNHILYAKEHYHFLESKEKKKRALHCSRISRESKNSQSKLTEKQVIEILQKVNSKDNIQKVADEYNVHYTTI